MQENGWQFPWVQGPNPNPNVLNNNQHEDGHVQQETNYPHQNIYPFIRNNQREQNVQCIHIARQNEDGLLNNLINSVLMEREELDYVESEIRNIQNNIDIKLFYINQIYNQMNKQNQN
ncbi:hypothetical protein H8356DRAFT_1731381 [Neocallimastix lanati (nom. inval.)]|uniref:Uncharacterized protein n=1 Tax=Neocallimastix californiae TaxID=1754190 RepID=A0A1Y2C004_9FUNG|nr:hypothetical protein H8356DRAFT_1731381 [Neocallimastix sp. JGI-2020a]ORY40306.1 hypothetical protein LY90DRAFT_672218 [Neocallimastix californiae]|eukprot:ORY40306.1 hypothetical protein LY90DRAFT_672218 [Neocallimastix californiae]